MGSLRRWVHSFALRVVPAALLAVAPGSPASASVGAPDPPPPLRVERCQHAIDQASDVYRTSRLLDLARGRRSARKAERLVRLVSRACEGVIATPDAPSFGDPCDERVVSGEPVSGVPLALCLRATLEREVGSVAPLPPNVVLVLTDDQRPETLEYMPEIDRLRQQGIHFRNAFATSALCTPSRASLYSGLYAHHHGSTVNLQDFDDRDTLAPWLSGAGYATGFFGKYRNDALPAPHVPPGWSDWQIFAQPDGASRFDHFFGYSLNENGRAVGYGSAEGDYSTDLLAERLIDFVRRNAERPFLAVFAPAAPHVPATPAPRHQGRLADTLPWRPPNWGPRPGNDVPAWMQFLRLVFTPELAADVDARRIAELESLQAVDEAVGVLIDELEALGIADRTLLVFTSDQGIHWGEHGWASKSTAYEPSIRVPLVVRYPVAMPLPAARDELVLNIDLAPSVAAAAGIATPLVDGASWLPLLAGTAPWRGGFLIENSDGLIARANRAIRTRRWKYIETASPTGVFAELYDLERDPHELSNLADDREHRLVRAILARSLAELHAR